MAKQKTKGLTPLLRPHKYKSREVKEEDFEKIFKEAYEMIALMQAAETKTRVQVYALAHCQIRKTSAMRFFVLNPNNQAIQAMLGKMPHNNVIYIEPEIIKHTKATVDSSEGCVSYLGEPNVTVQRYNKVTVKYATMKWNKKKTERITTLVESEQCSGLMAKIFQHEIDHFNAKYVYDGHKTGKK